MWFADFNLHSEETHFIKYIEESLYCCIELLLSHSNHNLFWSLIILTVCGQVPNPLSFDMA